MLTDRVLHDLDVPEPDDRGGNPLRGSRLGACARQSAYMLYPAQFAPSPLPARAKLVFQFGNMIHDLVRSEFRRVLPGQWGMEEERFHFKVPLSVADAKAMITLADRARHLRVTIVHGVDAKDLLRLRLVLDTAEPALYIPTHVDGIADLGAPYGFASVEIKSMATGSFRRALEGQVDYGYRVQMAVGCEAAELMTQVYVAVRKDTCHMLEVIYSRHVASVEVRFTKPSRLSETVRLALGDEAGGEDWEAAEVHHPFEPDLLTQARERVRRIITATPEALPHREYGPDFTCAKCGGLGMRMCRHCKGSGLTRVKRNACTPCEGRGRKECDKCEGNGALLSADLPWQCSYCQFVDTCWAGLYALEITDRPRYIVDRARFTDANLTILRPEPAEPLPVVADEPEEVTVDSEE